MWRRGLQEGRMGGRPLAAEGQGIVIVVVLAVVVIVLVVVAAVGRRRRCRPSSSSAPHAFWADPPGSPRIPLGESPPSAGSPSML